MRLANTILLAGLAIAPLRSAAIAQAPQPSDPESARVDSLFAQYTRGLTPGLAVAVVRDGKVLLTRGYGYASLETKTPITPSTVFDVASVSKQFAGLSVAMLVTEGRVKLTDDIRKYIPELGDAGHTVTVDHLLHHTSGYRDWPGTLALAGWSFDDVISFDQILTLAYAQRSLNFVPGAEYTYSNTGYNLLAEMVKRVSGKTFRQFTDERLFRPLGMTSSHFQDNHQEVVANRAYGYARRPDGTFSSVTNNLTALGSSSLFSTVEDLAKWVMNFDDPKVGGAQAMALTRTRGKLNDGSTIPYAFGVSHGDYRGQATVSHSGGWASFSTYVLHFPQQHFGVIVLANTGINTSRAAFNIADIYLGNTLTPNAAAVANALASAPAADVSTAVLDRYVGLYRLAPGWYVRLRRDGRELKSQATREGEVAVAAKSDTSFWVEAYSAPMTFQSVAGKPVQLTYRGKSYPKLADSPALSPAQLRAYVGEYESTELAAAYRVELSDSGLVMKHPRHGTIALTRLWKDDFTGSAWFTRSVEFQRDASGRVTGFAVFIDERSRDVRFKKR
ncbi:MAG TPA: serine hydrolase domain-containing protein [Gemmatimonadaceae bacterium]|nr:serine hydrolase domain-containing protein [Gemmatimonadaceae bacterium]